MMKVLLAAVAGMLVLSGSTAMAQNDILITQVLRLYSPSPQDTPREMELGIGSEYTDGVDGNGEFEIPFPPPQSFFANFLFDCDTTGGAPAGECRYTKDIRGIPDSVTEGVQYFSVQYKIEIFRNASPKVIVKLPALSNRIDSINVSDLFNGVVFSRTFGRAGGVDTIDNDGISQVLVTVYYNFGVQTGVKQQDIANGASVRLTPNPVADDQVVVSFDPASSVSTVMIKDIAGRTAEVYTVPDGREQMILPLQNQPSGAYFILLLDANGNLLGRERLVIQR